MMSKAIPSEREKVSFSLRGDRDTDEPELSICQLRKEVLSDGPNIYILRLSKSSVFLINLYFVKNFVLSVPAR